MRTYKELIERIDKLLFKQYRAILDAKDKRSAPKYIIRQELIDLINSEVDKAVVTAKYDIIKRITEQLVYAQSPEINEDDTGVDYYYTISEVDRVIERITNQVDSESAKLKGKNEH